jgi:hypothetical protein
MANKALLVGIQDYDSIYTPVLRGCHNDATNMRHILMNYFGFRQENISLLFDHRATKDRIRKRMDWLFVDAQPGDEIVFLFSGHGSYIRDLDGDESKRKLKDEVDELICLHGMDWGDPNTYFLDDELDKWVQKLPEKVNLTVIMDCCHAGTITREVTPPPDLAPPRVSAPPTATPLSDDHVIRGFAPPLDIRARIDEREPWKLRQILGKHVDRPLNHVLLAACQPEQRSEEDYISDGFNGAFTYYLCRTIRNVGTHLTYNDLIAHVRQSLEFHGYRQVPQFEGPRGDEQIFGGGRIDRSQPMAQKRS